MTSGGDAILFGKDDPRTPLMLWTNSPGGTQTTDKAQNVESRLVEVRNPRPILAAIGELLSGGEGDQLAASLRQDLFPTPQEQAAAVTTRIADLKQFQAAVAAYRAAVEAREKALAEATGKPNFNLVKSEQDAAVEAGKLAVLLAAERAGIPAPLL
ncbi:MAG: hypothetical protein AAF679_01860 [Pseudomonadota bacterium]